MKIVRKHQYATFFVSLIACPASVWAQDGAAAQDGSVPEETGGSSEIIVTGTKRSSSLQDTPVAVTALSSDDITTRGLSSTEDLVGQIPNFQLSAQTGAALVSIRGVGLGVETAAAEPGVAIHVDGVYQPRATTSQLATLDLERIEVLRGPQGTLYGRNATGGVINFISKAPTSYFEAEASLKVGNYDLIGGQAMVSGPLAGDDLLGRFVAYRQSRSGYVDNILLNRKDGDLDEWGGRLSLQWRAGDDTTVDLVARYAEVESSPVTVMITPPSQDDIDFMLATSPPGTQFITTNEPFEIAEERIGEGKTTDFGVNLTVNSEFGDLDFRSISGFTRSTVDFSAGVDGFNIPFLILDPRRDQSESFSQEFNLSSSGGRFEWTVGAFGFYEKYKVNFRFPFPNLGIVQQFLAEPEKTWSYAAFGDFSYSLLDDLRIIGGLRLGHDRKTIVNDALTFSYDDPSMLLDSVSFEGEYENTTLAPKIGLQYDFTEDVMGYFVFQQDYKGE
ncbi:TonB-dependent receptor, partial [Hoeflea sp.]|uniref:TonB-dependent receptor n=1 Tax=Hoeflea sp. TaxID=1940281 RepID=UPI0019C37333